jgi:hypothetical protein
MGLAPTLAAARPLHRHHWAMKNHFWMAAALLAAPRLALAAPDTSSIATKAKAAFADITKAKTALNAGKTKTSESWLTKAETLLKAAMDKAPGGSALTKANEAAGASQQGDPQKTSSALAAAQGEAQKLDPALAEKLGLAKSQAQQGDAGATQSKLDEARSSLADKTGLSGLQNTYQQVTLAHSLLKGGDSTKAKGVLDQIPTSKADVLKSLAGL